MNGFSTLSKQRDFLIRNRRAISYSILISTAFICLISWLFNAALDGYFPTFLSSSRLIENSSVTQIKRNCYEVNHLLPWKNNNIPQKNIELSEEAVFFTRVEATGKDLCELAPANFVVWNDVIYFNPSSSQSPQDTSYQLRLFFPPPALVNAVLTRRVSFLANVFIFLCVSWFLFIKRRQIIRNISLFLQNPSGYLSGEVHSFSILISNCNFRIGEIINDRIKDFQRETGDCIHRLTSSLSGYETNHLGFLRHFYKPFLFAFRVCNQWVSTFNDKVEHYIETTKFANFIIFFFLLLFALFSFLLVFYLPIPDSMRAAFYDDHNFAFLGVILLILFLVFKLPGFFGIMISLVAVIFLFSITLSGVWLNGISKGFMIGGLFPFSDAQAYYQDARHLVLGYKMVFTGSHRPLFAATLASLLWLFNGNLIVVMSFFCITISIVCFALSREVKESYGTIEGVIALLMLFFFYRTWIGQAITEQLGFLFGVFAFTMLLRGARNQRNNLVFFGIFWLSMSLLARAGPFPVVVLIAIWGAILFKRNDRFSKKFLAASVAIILLSIGIDQIIRLLTTTNISSLESNYSFVLYGLAKGNLGWQQIYRDHPEFIGMSNYVVGKEIYDLAFVEIRNNPFGLIKGLLLAYGDFFSLKYPVAFSFISPFIVGSDVIITRIVAYFLCFIGSFSIFKKPRKPETTLVLSGLLGILLSIPLAPPIDSTYMRVYASVIPIFAILVAIGINTIRLRKTNLENDVNFQTIFPSKFLYSFSLLMMFPCFVIPVMLSIFPKNEHLEVQNSICPPDLEAIILRKQDSLIVHLVDSKSDVYGQTVDVPVNSFRQSLKAISRYPEVLKIFSPLEAGSYIIQSVNLNKDTYEAIWLISDFDLFSTLSTPHSYCVKKFNNGNNESRISFYQIEGFSEKQQ